MVWGWQHSSKHCLMSALLFSKVLIAVSFSVMCLNLFHTLPCAAGVLQALGLWRQCWHWPAAGQKLRDGENYSCYMSCINPPHTCRQTAVAIYRKCGMCPNMMLGSFSNMCWSSVTSGQWMSYFCLYNTLVVIIPCLLIQGIINAREKVFAILSPSLELTAAFPKHAIRHLRVVACHAQLHVLQTLQHSLSWTHMLHVCWGCYHVTCTWSQTAAMTHPYDVHDMQSWSSIWLPTRALQWCSTWPPAHAKHGVIHYKC